MSKDGRIWLSHSGLEIRERCPRCFWLQYKKQIRQPEGIVSRLANRFDVVMKNYFNTFRGKDKLPPMVEGKLDGLLERNFQEKYFVRINEKYGFLGRLDECLVNSQGAYIPVDFKTASSDPRGKETLSAYQAQIDDYIFLLEKSGKKAAGFGYLVYLYPDETTEPHNGFPMVIHVVKLAGDPGRTLDRIQKAIPVLEGDHLPAPRENCPFCSWYEAVRGELNSGIKQTASLKSSEKPVQQAIF